MKKINPTEKVLVTGGGGFLGSAIVRRLVDSGQMVASFSRTRHATLENLAVEQIQGDVADPHAVLEACSGASLVFHTAAKPGVWGAYRDYFRTNVLGTHNVLEACRVHGVQRLIHTSSPSVVFDGRDMAGVDESAPYPPRFRAHYPRTKALAEQSVRAAAGKRLQVLVLRPHLIWGPGDNHLVPRILARADRLARIGDGTNLVDTTYIDNAAEAHLLAADRLAEDPGLSGRVYFISQGEPVPLWEMIDHILQAGGHPPVRRRLSKKTAWLLGTALEAVYKGLRRQQEPPLTRFVAEELATAHWFDISAARRELGYSPRISTAVGLARLAQWLQNPDNPGVSR